MLTIGIAIAFLLALFVLLPILVIRSKIVKKTDKPKLKKTSKYVSVMKKITKLVLKGKYVIVAFALLLAVVGFVFDQKVDVETDMEAFMPQDSVALDDIKELRELIGSTDRIVLMYEAISIDDIDTLSEVQEVTNMIFNLWFCNYVNSP